MIKNNTGEVVGAGMVNASTGGAFVGTVTVYVTGDAGTQAIGSVGSGICTAEGNGYFTYLPAQAETNYDFVAFTFTGSGAIPQTIQIAPITEATSTAITQSTVSGSVVVSDLLTYALQRLLAGMDTPSADELNTALLRLNDLLDAWKIEGLMVNTIARTTWVLTTASSYTVGASGTIAIDRPSNASLLRFGLQDNSLSPAYERPMANYTEESYRALTLKTLTATYPNGFYYNPTTPTGTLKPWPVPSGSNLSGVVYAPSPVGEVALTDTILLPQGYRRLYRDNLAVELATDFDVDVSPLLLESAKESKASAKRANVRMSDLTSEAACLGGPSRMGTGYEIYNG